MATKKTSTAVAVAVPKKTGGALVDAKKLLADIAKKQATGASTLSSGSQFVQFKNGQLIIDSARMPDDRANVVVLATMQERAYYTEAYDPDNPASPVCYAFGEVHGGPPEEPHEKASDPQHDTCKGCPHAEYGSAERGRGQACRQMVRLAIVAADGKTEGTSTIYQAKVPPTSLKNVKGWLDEVGARELAPVQVVTQLSCTPDPKTQLQVHLKLLREVDDDTLGQVLPRISAAERMMQEPYPEFEEAAPKKAAKKPAGKRKF